MDLTVVGQTYPPFNPQISVSNFFTMYLNRFAEFSRIYRKYLNRQIFYKLLLIFMLLEQQIITQTRNVFIGGAPPMYVTFFVYLSVYPSFYPSCDLRNRIFFLSTYFLLNWQTDIFLSIRQKSANYIRQVSCSFSKKKQFSMGAILTDVFLKTACVQTCLIKLIEGLGNESNHR